MKKVIIIGILVLIVLIMGCTNEGNSDIDLSNCRAYFDGCNSCEVVEGEITACTEMACTFYEEPRCVEFNP